MLDNFKDDEKNEKKYSVTTTVNWVRYFYFSYFFAWGCISYFQNNMLKKVGLDHNQTGTLNFMNVVGGIIGPIILGFLADKTKKSKIILAIIVAGAVIFSGIPLAVLSVSQNRSNAKIRGSLNETKNIVPRDEEANKRIKKIVIVFCFTQFIWGFCDQGIKALTDGVAHIVVELGKKNGQKVEWSKIRMFGGLGVAISLLITGVILTYVEKFIPPSIPSEVCMVGLSIIMGVTCVFSVILYIPNVEAKEKVAMKKTLRSLIDRPNMFIILMIHIFVQFGVNLSKNNEALYIEKTIGAPLLIAGLHGSIQYIFDSIFMFFSGIFVEILGSKEMVIFISMNIGIVKVILYSFATNHWIPLNNGVLSGFIIGLSVPSVSNLVKETAPKELINSYISLLTTIGKIGAACAVKLGGKIAKKYNFPMVYKVASIPYMAGAAAVCLLVFWKRCYRPKKEERDRKEKLITREDRLPILANIDPSSQKNN